MAQESISAVPFFPDPTGGKVGAKREAADEMNVLGKNAENRDASFGKALRAASNRSSILKVDKPKMGNREPFFPMTPMPYHPEPGSAAPLALPAERIYDAATEAVEDAQGFNDLEADFYSDIEDEDDEAGLMMQSYDAAAVSYPVSRIANESLDEETRNSLEMQGLWTLPTTVAAQPNAKIETMAVTKGAVPVQKPIAQFMASLESELGVSPDRLVKAFEQLPPGQLQLPPEQTMVQVVKNLNLEGTDKAKAMDLYSKMLVQMEKLDQRMQAQPLVPVIPTEAPKMVTGPKAASLYAQAGAENTVAIKGGTKQVKLADDAVSINQTQGLQAKAASVNSKTESAVPVIESDPAAGASNIAGKQGQGEFKGLNPDLGGQGSFGQPSQDQSNGNSGQKNAGPAAVMAQNGQSQTGGLSGAVKEQSKPEVKLKTDVTKLSPKHAEPAAVLSPDPMAVNNKGFMDLSVVGMEAGKLAQADGNQAKQEAIQNIVNNAQMLAQKGGGEMKLTLRPDHLGEIQLKVALEGSRVDVQMVTERNDVKKMIEQGVQELRNGLAQHNLSMEKLDVSVSDKNAGSFQRGQPDFSAARDFANQFHQQQQSRREQMFDMPGIRSMPHHNRPASTLMTASAAPRQGSSSGKLNVVA